MIIPKFNCARCGQVIPQEHVKRYGSTPISVSEEYLFLIKHRFSGEGKGVQNWRSEVLCQKCSARLEKAYKKFMGAKKKEGKNAN